MRSHEWARPGLPDAAASLVGAQRQVRWKVVKKLLPGQPGTNKLMRQYGAAMVCVRYRLDETGCRRCTTIELMVDHAPATPRAQRIVGVRVRYDETALRAQLAERGARWDRAARLWRLPHRAALALGLEDRIVEN